MNNDRLLSAALPEQVLAIIQEPGARPLDKMELSRRLGLPSDDRRSLREALAELEKRGAIVRLRNGRFGPPAAAELIPGIIEIHRNGRAHLLPEVAGTPDLAIAPEHLGTAMHGDKVLARRRIARGRSGAGPGSGGEVVQVVQRRTDQIVGRVTAARGAVLELVADDPRFAHTVEGRAGEQPLAQTPRPGDKVVVRLDAWEDPRLNPTGVITEWLGPAHAPGVDMLSVIRKFGLPTEFPPEVVAEAEAIPEEITAAEMAQRVDLRERLIFTIDPDDARDFDDAIDVEPLGEGRGWRVGVHIADVSHYVQPGTALEAEAQRRGNSTYLADRVLPMLPERLSNGLCSLKPHVDRLAFSAFLEFDAAGRPGAARFARTIIRSAARLSYRQALALLSGEEMVPPLPPSMKGEGGRGLATFAVGPPVRIEPEVGKAVREAWRLAELLRRNRFANGSLDLDFPEVKIWLDAEGKAVRLEKQENDISHQLIEEYMLAANEAVARELKVRNVPALYRVHEDPSPERLGDFRDAVRRFGVKAGDLTHRDEAQRVLAALRGLPEEYALKLQFLKSLQRAVYGVLPLGHYGLAKVNYTHFTSPIRRYADLIVHRSLERARQAGEAHEERGRRRATGASSTGELGAVAVHLSATERVSSEAEKESSLLKKLEYFQRQALAEPPMAFRAIVTDVRTFGLLVELPEALITGLVPRTLMQDDTYFFDPVRGSFTGRRSRRTIGLGTELQVVVAQVDLARRLVDFAPAKDGLGTEAPAQREQPRRRPAPGARSENGSRPRRDGGQTNRKDRSPGPRSPRAGETSRPPNRSQPGERRDFAPPAGQERAPQPPPRGERRKFDAPNGGKAPPARDQRRDFSAPAQGYDRSGRQPRREERPTFNAPGERQAQSGARPPRGERRGFATPASRGDRAERQPAQSPHRNFAPRSDRPPRPTDESARGPRRKFSGQPNGADRPPRSAGDRRGPASASDREPRRGSPRPPQSRRR